MNKSPKDVDAYIAAASKGVRGKLKELRATIRKTAPEAEERISYGMPYYDYKGRLAYFAAFKKHIGLYVPTPVIEEHKSDLKGYETAKATVRFPINKPLPVARVARTSPFDVCEGPRAVTLSPSVDGRRVCSCLDMGKETADSSSRRGRDSD